VRGLLIKQHRLSEPGLIDGCAAELGVELLPHVPSEEGPFPPMDAFDFVVAMGAAWSVYGPEVEPWIEGELRLLREAVDRDVPVLGICFGAQAFAQALGGDVRKADRPELGWNKVQTEAPDYIPEGPWFMWHSDRFTVPAGATLLARTDVCPQAFTLGPHLLVQFHPEVTPALLELWMSEDVSDFERTGTDPEAVLEETKRRQPEARERAGTLLGRFLKGVAARH
jgi:GMP synthase-like glutamine amidotransferase